MDFRVEPDLLRKLIGNDSVQATTAALLIEQAGADVLPEWFTQAVAAKEWAETKSILNGARHQLELALYGEGRTTEDMFRVDVDDDQSGPVITRAWYGCRRDLSHAERARLFEDLSTVRSVQDAVNAAQFDQWREELIAELKSRGLANAAIDYAGFRRLTTFDISDDSPHTSEDSNYAYRRDELGNIVGIEAGSWLQGMTGGQAGIIAAKYQGSARISAFPITAEWLVGWIRNQGGDVELAADGRYPVEIGAWLDFLAEITSLVPPPSKEESPHPLAGKQRNDPMSKIIGEALQELGSDAGPSIVMGWLKRKALEGYKCLIKVAQDGDGVFWRDGNKEPSHLTQIALKKRLSRLRGASQKGR